MLSENIDEIIFTLNSLKYGLCDLYDDVVLTSMNPNSFTEGNIKEISG